MKALPESTRREEERGRKLFQINKGRSEDGRVGKCALLPPQPHQNYN